MCICCASVLGQEDWRSAPTSSALRVGCGFDVLMLRDEAVRCRAMEGASAAQKALQAGKEAVAPWSRNLLVRTPYGWGKIRHLRGSGDDLSLVVKLDWHGMLYTRPSELRER